MNVSDLSLVSAMTITVRREDVGRSCPSSRVSTPLTNVQTIVQRISRKCSVTGARQINRHRVTHCPLHRWQ
jgi:hypothetical protein